jgi:hypothetical protein
MCLLGVKSENAWKFYETETLRAVDRHGNSTGRFPSLPASDGNHGVDTLIEYSSRSRGRETRFFALPGNENDITLTE